MRLKTSTATKVVSMLLFGVLYVLATPARHPYFNTPAYLTTLAACIVIVVGFIVESHGGVVRFLVLAFLGHMASVIAYVVAWSLQDGAGVVAFLQRFGTRELLFSILTVPFFSYSFAVLPIAVALASLVSRDKASGQSQT